MSIGRDVRERNELGSRLRAAADAPDMRRVGSSLAELEYLFKLVVLYILCQLSSSVCTYESLHALASNLQL